VENLGALMVKLAKGGKRVLLLVGAGVNSVPADILIATCRRSAIHIDIVPGVDRAAGDCAIAPDDRRKAG
jgi:hypothetical protein